AGLLLPFLAERGIDPQAGGPDQAQVVKTLQERDRTMIEMAEGALFYYRAPEEDDQADLAKFDKEHLKAVFSAVVEKLAMSTARTAAEFDALFKELCAEKGWKMPQVGQPVRIALSGGTQAPGIGEIVETLGVDETVRRINLAREVVAS